MKNGPTGNLGSAPPVLNPLYRTEEGAQRIKGQYKQFLRYWPVDNEHLRIATRYGETFVIASGVATAPPLILFHSGGANSAIWMADVAVWSQFMRVFAIDIIGEPGLSAQTQPALDSDAHALWLDDVLGGLGVERVACTGMSFGGWIALDYATRRPERVERLVLLSPGGIGRPLRNLRWRTYPLMRLGSWGRRVAMRMAIGSPPANPPPGYQEFLDYSFLVYEEFRQRSGGLPRFSDAALERLDMPVLAMLGAKDRILDTLESKTRLERLVPTAKVCWLPAMGHAIFGERSAITEFLRDSGGKRNSGGKTTLQTT